MLKKIYGELTIQDRNPGPLSGEFIEFLQQEFITNPRSISMAETGWVYVPASCANKASENHAACKLHVSFHGCHQNQDAVGDSYIKNSGLNQWADTNKMIVLYPQTVAAPNNPNGCFDWWGYNEPDDAPSSKLYDTKKGAQIKVIKAMIDRIAGN